MRKIVCIFLCLLLLLSTFVVAASADNQSDNTSDTDYSNVLDDLSKDASFNEADYPDDTSDNSLYVIQVAEGIDNELFLYVHQPSASARELIATRASISLNSDGTDPSLYDLTLLNKSGSFQKYKVEGITVNSSSVLRYYNVISILREFDSTIDIGDSTISEVPYPVGKNFTAFTSSSGVVYSMTYIDVVHVTVKIPGFIRYFDYNPSVLNAKGFDSQFVAFSTDHDIDDLLSAKVVFDVDYIEGYYYREQDVYEEDSLSNLVGKEKYLKSTEIFSKDNLFYEDYEYHRIQSTEEFLAVEGDIIDDQDTYQNIEKSTEWVLRFYESDFLYNLTIGTSAVERYTFERVTSISILELEFECDGKTYKLGVVDNVVIPDTKPDGIEKPEIEVEGPLSSLISGLGSFAGEINKALTDINAFLIALRNIIILLGMVVLIALFVKFITWLFPKKNN